MNGRERFPDGMRQRLLEGTEMKDHHEYHKIPLGESDVATIVLRSKCISYVLSFGEDGGYSAYLVDEECEIPDRYELMWACVGWLWIYDDKQRTVKIDADRIDIYRCGMKGCIIQTFGESTIERNIFAKGEDM